MLRATLLILLLPVLVSCGGDGDKAADADSEPSASTSRGRSSSSADPTPEAKQLTEKQLKKALPTLDDMPAGFSASVDDSDDQDSKDLLCGAEFNGDKQRNAKASVDYGAQEGLSAQEMSFSISQYDSSEPVEEQLKKFAAVVHSCDKFRSGGDTYTVTPMSAGHIGDRTVAVKMSTKTQGFDVTVNAIVVGAGPSLVTSLSASAGLTGSTVGDLVRLTMETVDRYESKAAIH